MDEVSYIKIRSNEDHNYLNFLTSGLQLFPDRFKLGPEDHILQQFPSENKKNGFTLGATLEDRLIGIITFFVAADRAKLAHIGELSRMYISPEAQGKGIGLNLIKKLLETVASEYPEVRQVKLNVATHNESAKKLYKKLGFEHYATEKDCIKLGERFLDDDSMVLFLEKD
ncbi:GNAT family N-acetyltransferase [Pedobacter sp. JY14-1]|uniref:GNAT family N-acetyltransferase n=1 Tax=Pedobacter sp. JY14-1 TaxID=3034151 RepID=UPI0023E206A8|nr:GNAT family N-acetyltransferase [Pedobacter sp. JY14-1]